MTQVLFLEFTLFVTHPTERASMAQGLFSWVQTQGSSPDTPGGSKNVSGLIGIFLKRGASHARH